MIVWLASYPRSGNTLLRIVLKEAFGKGTFSQYNDLTDVGSTREFARTIAHLKYPMSWKQFYELASRKKKFYFVKTHGSPIDDSPAIYVIRDGRASVVSYKHYLDHYGRGITDLREVILGNVQFGGWSSHVQAWDPEHRPNTLLVKYEDLASDPKPTIRQISEFLRVPVTGTFSASFPKLHHSFPEFFRAGQNKKMSKK